ncbi:LLM class flavin-dependent oxidoreductase [Nocardia sp. NPDC051463]|uniref:LLM class flavin-dependent oxidoreductase n=1 Tax=Nocardia sp. NPDC051463 TaxID=3154845 RepID=UPI00344D574D
MSDSDFFLGVELTGTGVHPASWRRDDSRAEDLFTGGYWVDTVAAAESAGVDAVFVPDSFGLQQGGAGVTRGVLDAVAITARVAARTHRIGLIAQAAVTHTEPFHLSKAIASLDFASLGRAGWEVTVSEGTEQARAFGRKDAQTDAALWHEADEAIDVVTRLWDSWEDDAEIRDKSTGRFIDREKLHYIDFVGANFSVKGPSITPRSPQGLPIIAVRAADAPSTSVAVHRADLIRVAATDLDAAAARRTALRAALAAAGRDPDTVRVLLDIDIHLADTEAAAHDEVAQLDRWVDPIATADTNAPNTLRHLGTPDTLRELITTLRAGAPDGVVLRPLAAPAALRLLAAAPLLGVHTRSGHPAGVRIPTTGADSRNRGTLRSRLGLPRPASRYAQTSTATSEGTL